MSARHAHEWNPILAPSSKADPQTHAAYFEDNAESPPTAVLVFHGIGEQVRFETLSRTASLILVEAQGRGATDFSVVIRPVPRDAAASWLDVRTELGWTEADGTKRQVHVYEAYWAPLTAGTVTYWETMAFLGAAGWNGLRGAFLSGKFGTFKRWLFGGFRVLKASPSTVPLLLVLLLMMVFIAAIIAMAASAAAGAGERIGAGGNNAAFDAANFIYNQIAIPWNAIVQFVATGWAHLRGGEVNMDSLSHIMFNPTLSWEYWDQGLLAFALWAALIKIAFSLRSLLTEFAGSLVAYLSPYKKSKFDDLRRRILQIGSDAASMIFDGHKLPSGWIPKYERIIILGHSLGSVVAYDTLNAQINVEAARNPVGTPNCVVERTKAFITFGCPLDKTAFLFRVQLKLGHSRLDQDGELRETMVCAVQPLITNYQEYRFNPNTPAGGPKWINIWSRMDVVSGRLDYYDDPHVDPNSSKHVQNMKDPGAWIPLAAHNQYWTTPLLRKTVYDQLF